MLGRPKYNHGDVIKFRIFYNDECEYKEGIIAIIDAYGTFRDNTKVYYDILVKPENNLYKHIPEDRILEKVGEAEPPFGNPTI